MIQGIHANNFEFNSIPIIANDLMCIRHEWTQIKFPKSKKKRIRNKWKKKRCNWDLKEVHFMVKLDGKMYVSSKIYKKLQEKIPYPNGEIKYKNEQ